MKVVTLVGTRPEIIRLSRVIARFDERFDHVLAHTGQNWDQNLSGRFFEEMDIREPDHYFRVDPSSLGSVLAGVMVGVERVLNEVRPDAFLVLGDTNSALGAIIAKRMKVPVYHMEAGNRCFDENVPEETNRRVVDHVADFNCVYTEHARRNLLDEGIHPRRILLTGSPMREVIDFYRPRIEASTILRELDLKPEGFLLVSVHREETVDHPKRLKALMQVLDHLARVWKCPIVVSTHPRTRARLSEIGQGESAYDIRFLEPFGFYDYNKLQMAASCVLSDSGTVSEESAILGFKAITLRASMERPEALDAGAIIMSDVESPYVLEVVRKVIDGDRVASVPSEYLIKNTSSRMADFVTSTAPLHRFWSGLR